MQRVVLTGGPGAGKTATLDVLQERGYEIGTDAPRSIIRTRKDAGLSPRPDPLTFARQVFEREVETYRSAQRSPFFFERGVVEAVASLSAAGALQEDDVNRLLEAYRYQEIFIFPPWEEIYRMDDERDHTFDHSVRVYEATLMFYRQHGYEPIEVPRDTVAQRVEFVLDAVGGAAF